MISNMQQQNEINGYSTVAMTVAHSDKNTVYDGPNSNDNSIVFTNNWSKIGFKLNKDKNGFNFENNNNNTDVINSNITNSAQALEKSYLEQINDTHHNEAKPLSSRKRLAGQMSANSVAGQQNGDNKAPDHHARRPMNAFLIFCKRHRGIVREKYPNLENRSITKILGDWWASLDEEEKKCYTNLAKQYKDAFFSANPDFKWYKLPAPPLRAPSTTVRSHSHDDYSPESDSYDEGVFNHKSSSSDDQFDSEAVSQPKIHKISNSHVGMFKLADEAQMGGLNSLMAAAVETVTTRPNGIINETYQNKSLNDTENKESALQEELGKASSFFKRTIKMNGSDESDYYSSNSYQTNNGKTLFNIPSSDDIVTSSEKPVEFDCDEPIKTSRSCKGKRYKEFMNHKSNPILKKNKQRTSSSSSSSSLSQPSLSPNGMHSMNGHVNYSHHTPKPDVELSDHLYAASRATEPNGNGLLHTPNASEGSKMFSADDFDLEEKIKTLPALNLEKYLLGKRTIKKKRKLCGRRHNAAASRKPSSTVSTANKVDKSPKTIEEAKARLMVGSQKRKARKESITRRDIGIPAPASSVVEPVVSAYVPVLKAPRYDINLIQSYDDISKTNFPNVPNNLLILATMAERAASIEV